MREIKILMGTVDCHFERNARIACRNFVEGKPLFDGQVAPSVIPDPRYPDGFMIVKIDG